MHPTKPCGLKTEHDICTVAFASMHMPGIKAHPVIPKPCLFPRKCYQQYTRWQHLLVIESQLTPGLCFCFVVAGKLRMRNKQAPRLEGEGSSSSFLLASLSLSGNLPTKLGGGGTPPGEAYANARTDRVLFLPFLILQRVRF